jgi:2-polyprenyl-6-methoxyphenol hydroxylase-like FAD-dependent oxidoreductase
MSQPILIIGAGLGGLCLAQGLKRRNIAFKVFERDERHNFRAQGYRLRIGPDGVQALKEVLSPDLFTLFENTCAYTILKGVRIKPDGTKLEGDGPSILSEAAPMIYTVDRSILRDVLLSGLDDQVEFGKTFDHYTITGKEVTAYFTDKNIYTGSLLVGADGVGSAVRKQYLPNLNIIDTGMRIIFGKTPLREEFLERFPKMYHHGMSLVMDPDDNSRTSLLFESIHFPSADNVVKPQLPDPYMYWVLTTHVSNVPSYGTPSAVPARLARHITKSWNPALRLLFDFQDETQASTRSILSALPDMEFWEPSSFVTLLGDSIHVMPPTGAMGANTALHDGANLARRISDTGGITNLNTRVVGDYEADLRRFAKEAIALSWRGGLKSFRLRPVEECERIIL